MRLTSVSPRGSFFKSISTLMNSSFVIDDDTVTFSPTFGVALVTVKPGTIKASRDVFRIHGKRVCRLGDESSVEVKDCDYIAPGFPKKGSGTLTIQGLDSSQQSQRVLIDGQYALLKGSVIKSRFKVTKPALGPWPGSTPDPTPEYYGTAQFGANQSLGKAESAAVAGEAEEKAEPRSNEPVDFKLKIQDAFGPAANEPFVLTLAGVSQPVTGQTDADGLLTCQVPRGVRTGRLEVGEGVSLMTISLKFEEFPPVEDPKGQLWRLQNLGFTASGQDFAAAVKAFQKASQLAVNGTMDGQSQDALVRAHGC